ncbi:MAG: M23 family metallopeptidase [Dermatophilaceae bacterium]
MTLSRVLVSLVLAVTVAGTASDAAAAGTLPAAAAGARPAGGDAGRGRPVWGWPIWPAPRVVHPFDPPPQPWNPGHRGIDLVSGAGVETVLAADDGEVTHVGVIAGRGTVSILHAGDIKSTYEPVTSTLHVGDHVARGQVIGGLDLAGGHCLPSRCLHLGGLRRDSRGVWNYFDPLFLLAPIEIVLLPTGG